MWDADQELARRCLRGEPQAMQELDTLHLQPAVGVLSRRGFPPEVVAEARQLASIRLLMPGENGQPAALEAYAGEGPLGRFVQVVMGHIALTLMRPTRREEVKADDADEELILALGIRQVDQMLSQVEEREVVRSAVRQAIASLAPRERALLRFQLIDQRDYGDIGQIYGVSRATVSRWLSEARSKLAERTRAQVAQTLGARGADDLALSQIDLSLSRLLGGA